MGSVLAELSLDLRQKQVMKWVLGTTNLSSGLTTYAVKVTLLRRGQSSGFICITEKKKKQENVACFLQQFQGVQLFSSEYTI